MNINVCFKKLVGIEIKAIILSLLAAAGAGLFADNYVKDLMNQAAYSDALMLLKNQIATKNLSISEETDALWLLGICLVSLGRDSESEDTFFNMLTRAPDFFPKLDTSPKIRASFLKARQRYFSSNKNQEIFSADMKETFAEDGHATVTLSIGSAIRAFVNEIKINIRTIEESTYRSITFKEPLTEKKTVALTFPIDVSKKGPFFYFVELIGRYDATFQSIGSPYAPLKLIVSQQKIIAPQTAKQWNSLLQLNASWPILVGAILAVSGTLAYGLIKAHQY